LPVLAWITAVARSTQPTSLSSAANGSLLATLAYPGPCSATEVFLEPRRLATQTFAFIILSKRLRRQ